MSATVGTDAQTSIRKNANIDTSVGGRGTVHAGSSTASVQRNGGVNVRRQGSNEVPTGGTSSYVVGSGGSGSGGGGGGGNSSAYAQQWAQDFNDNVALALEQEEEENERKRRSVNDIIAEEFENNRRERGQKSGLASQAASLNPKRRVAKISADEVAKAAEEREQKRQNKAETSNRLNQIAEDVRSEDRETRKRRREHNNELAEQASQRVNNIYNEEVHADKSKRRSKRQRKKERKEAVRRRLDTISREELARNSAKRANARQVLQAQAQEQEARRLATSGHLDELAREEVARNSAERADARQALQAQAQEQEARRLASEGRLDELTDLAMAQLLSDVKADELEKMAAEGRLDERTNAVMAQLLNDVKADELERMAAEGRLDERTNAVMAQLLNDVEADKNEKIATEERLDELVKEELARSSAERADARQALNEQEAQRLASEQRLDERADAAMDEFRQEYTRDIIERANQNAPAVSHDWPLVPKDQLDDFLPRVWPEDASSQLADFLPEVEERENGPIAVDMSTSDFFNMYVNATNEVINRMNEQDQEAHVIAENQDFVWEGDNDVTGIKKNKNKLRKIIGDETIRQSQEYQNIKEGENLSEFRKNKDDRIEFNYDKLGKDERNYQRVLRKARNKIRMRFLNPSMLHIESEHVVTRTENAGKKNERTYAHIEYSERVSYAIEAVKTMFDCSTYNVMQLVQLRAGLGVDSKGEIGHIDPDEFKLTDDQFVELCRDICVAQREKGNPLAGVKGVPGNGVRDDTGRFVVVAKTRCFPLGYMPRQLIRDLSRSNSSALHQKSERQIQKEIAEQWINETYPQLLANTGGNLMFQARAIENMMRALMSIDGANPSDLKIPELNDMKTIMMMEAEKQAAGDKAIAEAVEEREKRYKESRDRFTHRYRKDNVVRDQDGNILSPGARRRNKVGDFMRGVSNVEKAAKTGDIFLWITNPVEAVQSMMEQGVGNLMSEMTFRAMRQLKGDVNADDYMMTDALREIAKTDSSKEAIGVVEALYRIGGHDAINAFISTLNEDDGREKYSLTNADLRRFLVDTGVMADGNVITDVMRNVFKIQPGQEAGFLANVQGVMNGVENVMLGTSGLFKEKESIQFVKMCMAEMGKSAVNGRESFTNSEVEQWAMGNNGEKMIRSLLKTDAGREAFMTQGITSIGRRSPYDHMLRQVMARNGMTELAVRTMFDRFPEYGVNKVVRQVPLSNTICYLATRGVSSLGDMLEKAHPGTKVGAAMARAKDYQAGGRMDFWEGFRKNLMYDTIMATNKLMTAALYKYIISMLGGIHPPQDDDNYYVWSEWIIGPDPESGIPIRWAWFMDDLSGVGLPLGAAWAIAERGDFSPQAVGDATAIFMDAVANFNSGTAVFDAIDLVNNFEDEFNDALGMNVGAYKPEYHELLRTNIELAFWGLIGDLTPSVVNQILPWSRDYVFREDSDARSASKVYDYDNYSHEQAESENRTKQTDYRDYMWRRLARNNSLVGWLMNAVTGAGSEGSDLTSYKYLEMPLSTKTDELAYAIWNKFKLEDENNLLPVDPERRKEAVYGKAEAVCQFIDSNYKNPTEALAKGFVIDPEMRSACLLYCHEMANSILPKQKKAAISEAKLNSGGWLEEDEYNRLNESWDQTIEHYWYLANNYFRSGTVIPTRIPRYIEQESDWETRYVNDNQAPATYLDYALPTGAARNVARGILGLAADVADDLNFDNLLGFELEDRHKNAIQQTAVSDNTRAKKQKYAYGNEPTAAPFYTQRTEGKGYNNETIPYWMLVDDNGELLRDSEGHLLSDPQEIYDMIGDMEVAAGRSKGANMRELFFGGQGTNSNEDGANERLNIPSWGVATYGSNTDGRIWRIDDSSVPDELKKSDEELAASLGINLEEEEKDEEEEQQTSYGYGGGYSRSYYPRSYGGYSGGGGGYSGGSYAYSGGSSAYDKYNPKIYSNPRQVYSTRAAGLNIRAPYKATNTYLRPAFYTKGSREAYRRQDF